MTRQELKIRLSDEERALLDAYAARQGVTAAAAVRLLLHNHARAPGRPPKMVARQVKPGARAPIERYELLRLDSLGRAVWRMHMPCGHNLDRPAGQRVAPNAPGARKIEGHFYVDVPERIGCTTCRAAMLAAPTVPKEEGEATSTSGDPFAPDVVWRRKMLADQGYTEEQIERVLADDERARHYDPDKDENGPPSGEQPAQVHHAAPPPPDTDRSLSSPAGPQQPEESEVTEAEVVEASEPAPAALGNISHLPQHVQDSMRRLQKLQEERIRTGKKPEIERG